VPVGLTLAVGSGDSEYTYFADKHLQHWVGPSHWKFQRKAAGGCFCLFGAVLNQSS
jgi:hypothetical protein